MCHENFAVQFVILYTFVSNRPKRSPKFLRYVNDNQSSVQGDKQNIPGQSINPVKSWETFVSQNEDSDAGSSFQQDHNNGAGGMSTKSTGSEVNSARIFFK